MAVAPDRAGEKAGPATYDLLNRPGAGALRVESDQDVEVVIEDGEPADGDGEEARQLLKPVFDPQLAVRTAFAEQVGASNASSDAVIPSCDIGVDEMGARDRRGGPLG
ncbi:hypothetical protein SAMN05444166_7372 [Singulisphaera sp. GP187]|uniref:hypothetical protein n=1 Tax=Singulisphaera sp. GP187 TaxID=1882752 RepID=UPI0009298970|nr:hypothetical protein [Singulisphaera sp. GP187]SIO64706.1 hypothetical protein SAMN05444166_7372 [Singulisphaera sp. GP187]